MDKATFVRIQDEILKLNSRKLAALIGANESTISGYRSGAREIPEYIAKSMETQADLSLGKMELPISLADLIHLSRRAEAAGLSVEDYLVHLIRKDGAAAAAGKPRTVYTPEKLIGGRLNEDSTDFPDQAKQPA